MMAKDGKLRETDCANTEGIFRIIQSIPSPKAVPWGYGHPTRLRQAKPDYFVESVDELAHVLQNG